MKKLLTVVALTSALFSCGGPETPDENRAPPAEGCTPLQLNAQVMVEQERVPAYRWQDARLADGSVFDANLADAQCSTHPAFDPFERLLFISIPAW